MLDNRVRIIGGQLRSRLVGFPDADDLRPTGDRVRETLFNWLEASIKGARVLDLYAGSGVLGFEAVSRGASSLVLIEKDSGTALYLKRSIEALGLETAHLYRMDAFKFLRMQSQPSFDIVFIDPPFATQLHNQTLLALASSGCLGDEARLHIELPKLQLKALQLPSQLTLVRQKVMGEVAVVLLRYQCLRVPGSRP